MTIAIGTKPGCYEIRSIIGVGGMAEVKEIAFVRNNAVSWRHQFNANDA